MEQAHSLGQEENQTDESEGTLDLLFLVATALQSLDPLERREYDEAVQKAPNLVANETKFIDFLRTEDMDPSKAAIRIAKYWKYRKQIFSDRWLLPMTQTGHGALSEQDIFFLRTGYTFVMSRTSGGPVALADMSRLPSYPPEHSNTRIVFYCCASMVPNDKSYQVDGVTIIQLVSSAPRPPVQTNPEGWKIFREALPFKTKRLLVAHAYEPWKEELIDSLGYQTALSARFKTRHDPHVIRGNSVASVANQLADMGIERQYIPHSHGGTFDYSVFADWTRMRLSLEDAMGSAPLANNMTFAKQPTQQLPYQQQHTHHHQPQQPLQQSAKTTRAIVPFRGDVAVAWQQQQTEESKQKEKLQKRRRRRRQAQYSIPAPEYPTESTRPYLGTVAEERFALQKINNRLRNENIRLQGLLAQAKLLVTRYLSGEDVSQGAPKGFLHLD